MITFFFFIYTSYVIALDNNGFMVIDPLSNFSKWELNENTYACSDKSINCGYLQRSRWNAHSCFPDEDFLWLEAFAALEEIRYDAEISFENGPFITKLYDAYLGFDLLVNKTNSLGNIELFVEFNGIKTSIDIKDICTVDYCSNFFKVPLKDGVNHLKLYGHSDGGTFPVQAYFCYPNIFYVRNVPHLMFPSR